MKSHAFTLIVIVSTPGGGVGVGVGTGVLVAVAVGGLNPGGAAASCAPTMRTRSPDVLSASAAYVKSGLPGSLASTVA